MKGHKALSVLSQIIQPAFVFFITLLVASLFATINVDPHHDGPLLKPAIDVAHGQKLYRETFSQYGALTTFMQAFALKMFGDYLIVIRLQAALIYALVSLMLWFIWARFIPSYLATFSALLLLAIAPYSVAPFLPWSSIYALFFQVGALYFIIKYQEDKSLTNLFLTGVSTLLSFWCRQPVGVALFGAISFYFLLMLFVPNTGFKKVVVRYLIFLSGAILVNAVFIGWLIYTDSLNDWWLQTIKYAIVFGKSVGSQLRVPMILHIAGSLFPFHVGAMWVFIPITVVILTIKVALQSLKQKHIDESQMAFIALLAVSLSSWLQNYPQPCFRHAFWSSYPMIGLVLWFLYDLFRNEGALFRITAVLLIVFGIFCSDMIWRVHSGYTKLIQAGYMDVEVVRSISGPVSKFLGRRSLVEPDRMEVLTSPKVLTGMRVPKEEARFIHEVDKSINDYVNKYPERGFVNWTSDLLYNTFTKVDYRFHPVKMYWAVLEEVYPDVITKRIDYIKAHNPIIIKGPDATFEFPGYSIEKNITTNGIFLTSSDVVVLTPSSEKGNDN